MSHSARYDIKLTAGDDFQMTVRLKSQGSLIDTDGYVFKAQARADYLPDAPLLVEFDVDPVPGGVVLSLTSEQTESLALLPRVVWDLQSESPLVRTWLSGRINVAREVTR